MGKPGKRRQSCKSGQLDSKQFPYCDRLPSHERKWIPGQEPVSSRMFFSFQFLKHQRIYIDSTYTDAAIYARFLRQCVASSSEVRISSFEAVLTTQGRAKEVLNKASGFYHFRHLYFLELKSWMKFAE